LHAISIWSTIGDFPCIGISDKLQLRVVRALKRQTIYSALIADRWIGRNDPILTPVSFTTAGTGTYHISTPSTILTRFERPVPVCVNGVLGTAALNAF
jgi:hypothetical protein